MSSLRCPGTWWKWAFTWFNSTCIFQCIYTLSSSSSWSQYIVLMVLMIVSCVYVETPWFLSSSTSVLRILYLTQFLVHFNRESRWSSLSNSSWVGKCTWSLVSSSWCPRGCWVSGLGGSWDPSWSCLNGISIFDTYVYDIRSQLSDRRTSEDTRRGSTAPSSPTACSACPAGTLWFQGGPRAGGSS